MAPEVMQQILVQGGTKYICTTQISFDMCEGCDTAWVPRPKQVVFLGGHTASLRPNGLTHKAVEHREEMQSHGSRILEPMCTIDLVWDPVKAPDIRFSSSHFRKQQQCHEKAARGYNQKADIWSLGITTIEMATGQAPYAKFAPMKVLMLTLQNDSPDIDSVATVNNQYLNYGHKFRKFTKACLMKDPGQRLSARELLSHTYIKSKAKDRELLCRVLLGGEMPPPISRINKHPDDRSEKRDPKVRVLVFVCQTVLFFLLLTNEYFMS
ncbi:unnamed protein product [Schistosoma curassoni]|uniref:Protein kinase domain-containing protein n=1 Tax=Schistosoma curassoni TaxID=6186 RepID=A0A183KJ59_9TREM|nr:unnamed protein product [Schistosoma curassoni]